MEDVMDAVMREAAGDTAEEADERDDVSDTRDSGDDAKEPRIDGLL